MSMSVNKFGQAGPLAHNYNVQTSEFLTRKPPEFRPLAGTKVDTYQAQGGLMGSMSVKSEDEKSNTSDYSDTIAWFKSFLPGFATADAEGDDNMITTSDLIAVYNSDESTDEMKFYADFLLTDTESGQKWWRIIDGATGTAGDNKISLQELNSLNTENISQKNGQASNIENAETALLEMTNEDIVKQLNANSEDPKTKKEGSNAYDRLALEKLAQGKIGGTQRQRDAAAFLLNPDNQALLEKLDTYGKSSENKSDLVYTKGAAGGVLDQLLSGEKL